MRCNKRAWSTAQRSQEALHQVGIRQMEETNSRGGHGSEESSQSSLMSAKGLQASCDSGQQTPRVFSEDESQKTDSEGEAESIEGTESEGADESSDEETSQDREMIDEAPREEEHEVVRHGRISAAMETNSEDESFSQVLARLKRRAPDGALNPLQSSRRRRVLLSSSNSSGEEEDSPSPGHSQAVSAKHTPMLEAGDALGRDCPMADDIPLEPQDDDWSDDLPLEPENDAWSDFVALGLEDEFVRACEIVPRPRWAGSQPGRTSQLPTATPERDIGDQSVPSAQPVAHNRPASPAARSQVTGGLDRLVTGAPQSGSDAGQRLRPGQLVRVSF